MKDNLFKRSAAVLILSGIFVSTGASAVVFNDTLNTLQNALSNLQDIEIRVYEEVEAQANRMLQKELSKVGMENEAAQSAQEITAKQRLEQNLRNQEVARQQAPLVDVCKDSGSFVIAFDGDIDCYRDDKTQANIEELAGRQDSLYDTSESDAGIKIADDIEQTMLTCFDYLHSQGTDKNVDPKYSHCLNASALVDSSVTTLQSGIIEQGAEKAVELLTEPVMRKKAFGSGDLSTVEGRQKRLNEHRKDMLIRLAQSVMLQNVELRRSSKWADAAKTKPIPSVLETLDMFNNNRLLSSGGEYLLKLGAAHKDKFNDDPEVAMKSSFTIEQVQRETAVMTAFLSYMSVLQYKSQLRIEQLEAAMLSVAVNPPE